MTKIICRFDDQASLDEMSMKLKGLSKEVLEYNLDIPYGNGFIRSG